MNPPCIVWRISCVSLVLVNLVVLFGGANNDVALVLVVL